MIRRLRCRLQQHRGYAIEGVAGMSPGGGSSHGFDKRCLVCGVRRRV